MMGLQGISGAASAVMAAPANAAAARASEASAEASLINANANKQLTDQRIAESQAELDRITQQTANRNYQPEATLAYTGGTAYQRRGGPLPDWRALMEKYFAARDSRTYDPYTAAPAAA
jgi:hypothetical protein